MFQFVSENPQITFTCLTIFEQDGHKYICTVGPHQYAWKHSSDGMGRLFTKCLIMIKDFVKSLPMLSEDNHSVNSCRSGHPWKHRQEPGGPGQHSKDQVLVTSFNTTPPQEYIQMIGHELQQGLNLLFYMYLCVHQYSWTSLILGEMLNSEMLNSEMLYGEMLLSPINWYTSFWRWGCSTVQQSQPTGIL